PDGTFARTDHHDKTLSRVLTRLVDLTEATAALRG
ncbi:MAG: NADPH-dependent oxidoreductase, partial [Kocuria rhizophila]